MSAPNKENSFTTWRISRWRALLVEYNVATEQDAPITLNLSAMHSPSFSLFSPPPSPSKSPNQMSSDNIKLDQHDLNRDLANTIESPSLRYLTQDLNRTLRDSLLFAKEDSYAQIMLQNVLIQLLKEEQIEYFQGMNFIAAFFLLIVFDEVTCSDWYKNQSPCTCFKENTNSSPIPGSTRKRKLNLKAKLCPDILLDENLIQTKIKPVQKVVELMRPIFSRRKYNMKEMFSLGMFELKLKVFQFNSLLQRILPNVYRHLFLEIGLNEDYFVTTWFLPIFTNSFPFKVTRDVMDVFLEKGWKACFRFAFHVLNFFKEKILNPNFSLEKISKFFRRDNPELVDLYLLPNADETLHSSDSFRCAFYDAPPQSQVKDKELERLEIQFLEQRIGIDSNATIWLPKVKPQNIGTDLVSEVANGLGFGFSSDDIDTQKFNNGNHDGNDFEFVQRSLVELNIRTQNDSASLREKVESAEKERQRYISAVNNLSSRLLLIATDTEDLLQAKAALREQVKLLIGKDRDFIREKLIWVVEDLAEKSSLLKKMKHRLDAAQVLLEETEQRKKAFSEQLLHVLSSAEQSKRQQVQRLRNSLSFSINNAAG